jgi:hypothetical protein
MKVAPAVMSRYSILILSFILVQTGLTLQLGRPSALNCVLAGTAGLASYVGTKWSAFLRNRALVQQLLMDWGSAPR